MNCRDLTPEEKQRLMDFAIGQFRSCFKNITFFSTGVVRFSMDLKCSDFLDGVPSSVLEKYRSDVDFIVEE